MLAVTENFKAAVNAATRNLDVVVKLIGKNDTDYTNARIYSSKDALLSLKIVDGQTTGGFSLGGTICPSLTAELHKTAVVSIGDKVKAELVVYNGGGNLTMASEFTVDNIKRKADGTLSVTALGNMIKLAKNYVSELTYPTTQLAVLGEIAGQTGFELHPLITSEMINDPVIQTAPVKGKAEDGSTLYYTRREMLGFAAAINGGAAYIDQYGRIGIARHNDTGETFTHERVLRETLTEPFTVEAVKWSSTGLSYSLGDDYNENTVEFYNPLVYNARELIAHNLETDLIGFGYDGATIKKQGCGYFEVGDIVHYVDINNTTHNLLILGIVYEFNDGYFSETLYSLTDTPTQREYTGSESVLSAPSTAVTSVALTGYEYLSDASVRYNGTTYTVEKDAVTGLISKISDDNGVEFSPTDKSGGNITDVVLHNAVFWAVAMLSRFGEPQLPPEKSIFNHDIVGLSSEYSTHIEKSHSSGSIVVSDSGIDFNYIGNKSILLIDGGINCYSKLHIEAQALNAKTYTSFYTIAGTEYSLEAMKNGLNNGGTAFGDGGIQVARDNWVLYNTSNLTAARQVREYDISKTIGKPLHIQIHNCDNTAKVFNIWLSN